MDAETDAYFAHHNDKTGPYTVSFSLFESWEFKTPHDIPGAERKAKPISYRAADILRNFDGSICQFPTLKSAKRAAASLADTLPPSALVFVNHSLQYTYASDRDKRKWFSTS